MLAFQPGEKLWRRLKHTFLGAILFKLDAVSTQPATTSVLQAIFIPVTQILVYQPPDIRGGESAPRRVVLTNYEFRCSLV